MDYKVIVIVLVILFIFYYNSENLENTTITFSPSKLILEDTSIPLKEYKLHLFPELQNLFLELRYLFYWDLNYKESVIQCNLFCNVCESLRLLKEIDNKDPIDPEFIKNYFDLLRRYRNNSVNKFNSLFVSNPEISQKVYYKKLYGVNKLWRTCIKYEEEIYKLYNFNSYIKPMAKRDLKPNEFYIH